MKTTIILNEKELQNEIDYIMDIFDPEESEQTVQMKREYIRSELETLKAKYILDGADINTVIDAALQSI